jgi:hypothetical protein
VGANGCVSSVTKSSEVGCGEHKEETAWRVSAWCWP